jgi:hypothetical protein
MSNDVTNNRHFIRAETVYVTPPEWGAVASAHEMAPENPWSKQHWNVTRQGLVFKQDETKAHRLARAAGHKTAVGARLEHAK